jgi:hypothetical protein
MNKNLYHFLNIYSIWFKTIYITKKTLKSINSFRLIIYRNRMNKKNNFKKKKSYELEIIQNTKYHYIHMLYKKDFNNINNKT